MRLRVDVEQYLREFSLLSRDFIFDETLGVIRGNLSGTEVELRIRPNRRPVAPVMELQIRQPLPQAPVFAASPISAHLAKRTVGRLGDGMTVTLAIDWFSRTFNYANLQVEDPAGPYQCFKPIDRHSYTDVADFLNRSRARTLISRLIRHFPEVVVSKAGVRLELPFEDEEDLKALVSPAHRFRIGASGRSFSPRSVGQSQSPSS